jgi:hypothetical protein
LSYVAKNFGRRYVPNGSCPISIVLTTNWCGDSEDAVRAASHRFLCIFGQIHFQISKAVAYVFFAAFRTELGVYRSEKKAEPAALEYVTLEQEVQLLLEKLGVWVIAAASRA